MWDILTLDIRIWLNDNFILLVHYNFILLVDYMLDLGTTVSRRQAVDLKLHRELATPCYLYSYLMIEINLDNWGKFLFPMSNQHFSFSKIQANNLNLDYSNVLTNQIDFCFPKLYFSPLIRTKIECINKQLLVYINWPNKFFNHSDKLFKHLAELFKLSVVLLVFS